MTDYFGTFLETVEKPEPGQECVLCKRRMPHPRKPSSPDTKVISYRVPVDEAEAHEQILEEAAKHLGIYDADNKARPHWKFWTYTYALAAVLQDESLRGAGQRSVIA